MNEKIVRAVNAPLSLWEKTREMGDGNVSLGFRIAIQIAFPIWEREQQQKWAERSKKGGAQ